MHDDPFARAVDRAHAAERAEAAAKRDRIERHVSSGARTAFRVHASVYLAVNLLLVVIWATTSMAYPWFLYPLLGWGIGLAAHYAATSNYMRRSNRRESAPAAYASAAPAPAPAAPTAPAPAPTRVATPSAGASTSDELTRLAELHASGVLTDKEFKAAKAKLLG